MSHSASTTKPASVPPGMDSKHITAAIVPDTKSSPAIPYTYINTSSLPPFNKIQWISSEWLAAISTKPATRGAFLFNPHRPERLIKIPLNNNEFILDVLLIRGGKIVIRKLYQARQNQKPREREQIDYFQTFVVAEIISTESGLALKNLHEGEYCCSPIYPEYPPTKEGIIYNNHDNYALSVLNNRDIMFFDRSQLMHKLNVNTFKLYSFPHFKTLLEPSKKRLGEFAHFDNGKFPTSTHYAYTHHLPSAQYANEISTNQICVRPLEAKGECITIDPQQRTDDDFDFWLNPYGFLYLYSKHEDNYPYTLEIFKPGHSTNEGFQLYDVHTIPAGFFKRSVVTYGSMVVFIPANTLFPLNIYLWDSLNQDNDVKPIPLFSENERQEIFSNENPVNNEHEDLKRNFKDHIAFHPEGIVYYAESRQRIYHIFALFSECYSLEDRITLMTNEKIILEELTEAGVSEILINMILNIVAEYLPHSKWVNTPIADFAEWAVRFQFIQYFEKSEENDFWDEVLPQVFAPGGDSKELKKLMQSSISKYKEDNSEDLSERSLVSAMYIERMHDLRLMEKNFAIDNKEVGKPVASVAMYYPPKPAVVAAPHGFFSSTYSSATAVDRSGSSNFLDEKSAARLAAAAPAGRSVAYSAAAGRGGSNSFHRRRAPAAGRGRASNSLNWRDRNTAPAAAPSTGAAGTTPKTSPHK